MSIGGHQSPVARSDTWLTPPAILEALGPFDLDPCTPPVMPWRTAAHRYTEVDDGLAQDWFGRVWLNPPYGRALARWMGKMVTHGTGTALIFARTETAAWAQHVWAEASAILFIEGRLYFLRADGSRTHNAGAPSALIAYGLDDADKLAESGIDGAFVPLGCVGQSILVVRHPPGLTWPDLIAAIAERQGGEITLQIAYALVQGHPKAQRNPNWKAKVRQTVQQLRYDRIGRGRYRLRRETSEAVDAAPNDPPEPRPV